MAVVREARNELNVIILTGAGHFTTHFFEIMFPTLAVALSRDTGVPLEEVLGWSFFGYLLFGLGALPAGMLADRLGARPMLVLAMGGMGVSAMAAAEVTSGRALSVCLATMGAFASVYHPAGMSLISRTISARGRALGINGMIGVTAIAVTPIISATLAARVGWHGVYLLTGFAMCAIATLCAFLPIDEHRAAVPYDARPRVGTRQPSGRIPFLFFLLCLAAMLAGISYRGNTLVQPAYFAERVSGLGFGATTSLVYLFGIGGQYLGGTMADRHDLRWLYLSFHALSLPALLAMALLTEIPLVVCAAVFVFFSLGMQPIENSLFAMLTPARWRATAYGMKFVLTFGVGSVAVWLVRWGEFVGELRLVLLCLAGVVALLLVVLLLFIAMSTGLVMRNDATTRESLAGTMPSSAADGTHESTVG